MTRRKSGRGGLGGENRWVEASLSRRSIRGGCSSKGKVCLEKKKRGSCKVGTRTLKISKKRQGDPDIGFRDGGGGKRAFHRLS